MDLVAAARLGNRHIARGMMRTGRARGGGLIAAKLPERPFLKEGRRNIGARARGLKCPCQCFSGTARPPAIIRPINQPPPGPQLPPPALPGTAKFSRPPLPRWGQWARKSSSVLYRLTEMRVPRRRDNSYTFFTFTAKHLPAVSICQPSAFQPIQS